MIFVEIQKRIWKRRQRTRIAKGQLGRQMESTEKKRFTCLNNSSEKDRSARGIDSGEATGMYGGRVVAPAVEAWSGSAWNMQSSSIGGSRQDLQSCWRAASRRAREMVKVIEWRMKLATFSRSFRCRVPKAMCNLWEDDRQDRYQYNMERSCQYAGVLAAGQLDSCLDIRIRFGSARCVDQRHLA